MKIDRSSLSPHILSVAALVLTALSYSFLSIGSRLLNAGFQPMTQTWLRIAIADIILMILMRRDLRWKRIRSMPVKDRWVLLMMGTVGYSVAVFFVTQGAINAKLVNVAVIFASVPFFSYLYASIFLKKPLDGKLIALLLTSLVGISFVATKSFRPAFSMFGKGEWFTLLATATMATFYVGRKTLSKHLNTAEITVSAMTIAAVSGFLLAVLRHEPFPVTAFGNTTVLLGLAIGVSMNVIVNPIEIYAFNHLDAVLGSQILLLENVFSLVLGYFLYRETVGIPELIGALIIIGSVYIANRYSEGG